MLASVATLPFGDLDDILADGPALVLAPHPDDESLGCGGLIAECAARGRIVHVAVLTDGAMSHPGSTDWPPRRLAMQRGAEIGAATAMLGVPLERLHLLGEPDGDAPHDGARFGAAAARLSAIVVANGLKTIVASWGADPHGDHGSAHKLAASVAASAAIRHVAYPIWSWMLDDAAEIDPALWGGKGTRLEMSRHLKLKRRAIAAHRSQRGELVGDDPAGFVLPATFLSHFDREWEAFLRIGSVS